MVAIKALSVLALAGATLATPVAQPKQVGDALERRDGNWYNFAYNWRSGNHGAQPTQTETVTTTSAAASSTSATAPAATATSTTGGSTGGSQSGGLNNYLSIVSEYRAKMGLPDLAFDQQLQDNAQDTADSSGGSLTHKLNPGTMAQVLAPGDATDFEKVFVGGWLCELPNLPGLEGICATMSQGWNYNGQTGHAEILSSTSYTKIGCALGDGIWSCDCA